MYDNCYTSVVVLVVLCVQVPHWLSCCILIPCFMWWVADAIHHVCINVNTPCWSVCNHNTSQHNKVLLLWVSRHSRHDRQHFTCSGHSWGHSDHVSTAGNWTELSVLLLRLCCNRGSTTSGNSSLTFIIYPLFVSEGHKFSTCLLKIFHILFITVLDLYCLSYYFTIWCRKNKQMSNFLVTCNLSKTA